MTDFAPVRALLLDAFGRVHTGVRQLTQGLDAETAVFRPDPGGNSIAWLIWHLSRVQDDHIADLAGVGQVWPRWRDRFDLPFPPNATGYGQSADEVGQVRASPGLLENYHDEVHEATVSYLEGLTGDELERVVDEQWDPPVTAAVRLVSVLEDTSMHLGQANYLEGQAKRTRDR